MWVFVSDVFWPVWPGGEKFSVRVVLRGCRVWVGSWGRVVVLIVLVWKGSGIRVGVCVGVCWVVVVVVVIVGCVV